MKDLVYQSLNCSDSELPSFKSILERVITTDTHIYCNHPYTTQSRPHPNSALASQALLSTAPSAPSTTAPAAPSNLTITTLTTSHLLVLSSTAQVVNGLVFWSSNVGIQRMDSKLRITIK